MINSRHFFFDAPKPFLMAGISLSDGISFNNRTNFKHLIYVSDNTKN